MAVAAPRPALPYGFSYWRRKKTSTSRVHTSCYEDGFAGEVRDIVSRIESDGHDGDCDDGPVVRGGKQKAWEFIGEQRVRSMSNQTTDMTMYCESDAR